MTKQDADIQVEAAGVVNTMVASAGARAALTEANRHKDVLFTSLVGVVCIVFVLLVALALPVFGWRPIVALPIYCVMAFTALAGIGELSFINFRLHKHITVQALLTEVLLNSLGQGYLSFDSKGNCGAVYSQACLDLLECVPAGRHIADVLHLNADQKSDFKDWMDMLFAPDHALSFDDVVKFLPQTFSHSSRGRHIGLVYRPVRDANDVLLSVVLIATDETDEVEAQLRTRMQQTFVAMISSIFKERNQFMVTLTHIRQFIEATTKPVKLAESAELLRLLHTLKASVKHFHMDSMAAVIHKLEADLRSAAVSTDAAFQERLSKGGQEIEACLKAVLEQLDDLIGQDFEGRGNTREIKEEVIYDFARQMRAMNVDAEVVRQYLSAIAAVPVNDAFRQFEREIKDLAEIMGKKAKPLQFTGSNPRVLLQPMEGFFMSIMHISRNIVDHGIEPVVTRLARGKDPAGQVTVHTDLIDNPVSGRKLLHIVIADDGNGIDPTLVRAKLSKIDPDGAWRYDDDDAVIQRILLWEVSTRTEVSEISGRGVGMEAVDREVKLLGGTIRVQSELYKGTKFDIRIPYGLDVPENPVKAVDLKRA